MQRQLPTRIIIAESGSPWFSLVAPSNGPTLVIAQTPGEQEEAFGRRVADRVTALATADISDIVLVSRKRAELRARKHATGWSLAALASRPSPILRGAIAAAVAALPLLSS